MADAQELGWRPAFAQWHDLGVLVDNALRISIELVSLCSPQE
jgi:hypothetical protein